MSTGVVVCSLCRREIHQDGERDIPGQTGWRHCDDKSPRCFGAKADYPLSDEPLGKWCGRDDIGMS